MSIQTIKSRGRVILALAAVLSVAGACGAPTTEESQTSLIGGREARANELPGVVRIRGCTGAKVGARTYLLAAHCLYMWDSPQLAVAPGDTIAISTAVRPTAANTMTLTIDRLFIHPTYAAARGACAALNCRALADDSFDVAFVRTREFRTRLPELTIDTATVAPFDAATNPESLTVTGYGCEDNVNAQTSPVGPRLKIQAVRAQPKSALDRLHGAADRDAIYERNFITNGVTASGASLCPGDSGGPVLAMRGGRLKVVGVNAYYSFPDTTGVASLNWHARLGHRDVAGFVLGALVDPGVPQLEWTAKPRPGVALRSLALCQDGTLWGLARDVAQLYRNRTNGDAGWEYVSPVTIDATRIGCGAGLVTLQARDGTFYMRTASGALERLGRPSFALDLATTQDATGDMLRLYARGDGDSIWTNNLAGADTGWRRTGALAGGRELAATDSLLFAQKTDGTIWFNRAAGREDAWRQTGARPIYLDLAANGVGPGLVPQLYALGTDGGLHEAHWP